MSKFKEITSCKERVKYLLTKYAHLRDDDNKLIATFWYNEIGQQVVANMNAMTFFEAFAGGNVTNPESIRRMRQKLQEEQPELRGHAYKNRHEAEIDVRTNINKP